VHYNNNEYSLGLLIFFDKNSIFTKKPGSVERGNKYWSWFSWFVVAGNRYLEILIVLNTPDD